MRFARPGPLAYLAFFLACVVPAWLCRPETGAEVQLRVAGPLFGRGYWSDLGPGAADYLEQEMKSAPSRKRRERAADVLRDYYDPVVRARVLLWRGSGFTCQISTSRKYALEVGGEHWGAAVDGLSDDELVVATRKLASNRLASILSRPAVWDFWEARPATCERVVSRILAATSDVGLASALAESTYHDHG